MKLESIETDFIIIPYEMTSVLDIDLNKPFKLLTRKNWQMGVQLTCIGRLLNWKTVRVFLKSLVKSFKNVASRIHWKTLKMISCIRKDKMTLDNDDIENETSTTLTIQMKFT